MTNKLKTRDVRCPECNANAGSPCKGTRIPGPNTLGGGWGGPVPRKRPHPARIQHRRKLEKSLHPHPLTV